ncbi:MAG: CehA/McbA family metallohydrolase [Deltaproteobacteria bacterium]|nr:CehA/McbA family metallohydrolase [Deltaproteobacteria bacterium]
MKVPANGQASYDRLFIVGDGDARFVLSAINAYDANDDVGTVNGTVAPLAGDSLEGIKVFVQDTVRPPGKNYVAVLLPQPDGSFSAELDPGIYRLTSSGPGRVDKTEGNVEVVAGQSTEVTIVPNKPGRLAIDVDDDNGDTPPCKVTLQSGHDAPPNADEDDLVYLAACNAVVPVRPGDYTVTVSRGFEYELVRENVTITAGAETELTGTLEHSVDSTGLLSGDFHVHAVFSFDAHDLGPERVTQLAAEGLELPVVTEHDVQVDFQPYVEEVGLEAWLHVVLGSEISPTIGHFNAWPLFHPEGRPDYYSLPFEVYDDTMTAIRRYEFPEMFEFARNDYGAQIVQINHPGGYFAYLGYDKDVGVGALDPDEWTADFEALEVFTGRPTGLTAEWFSFLDQGLAFTMTGNSDSHSRWKRLGSPRNVFAMPTDDPETADAQDMIDAIAAHRNQVSAGPLISFSIDGESIGGFVTGLDAGTDVDLDIVVQAPLWIDVDYLKVYSNHGTVVYDESLTPTGTVVRFDDTVTLAAGEDAYFVVEAGHTSAKLGPVDPGFAVRAITNPIWVDVDGNGEFDPPGLPVVIFDE